jgi:hypothetical protein
MLIVNINYIYRPTFLQKLRFSRRILQFPVATIYDQAYSIFFDKVKKTCLLKLCLLES